MNIQTTHSDLVNHHLPIVMNTHPAMSVGLISGPGMGKTYLMTHQVKETWAAANNVEPEEVGVLVYRTADREAAEFAGLMMPSKNAQGDLETVAIKPDLVRKIEDLRAQGFKYIVLVLDELLQSAPDVQKTLSSVLDRKENTLGGHDLGGGIFVCFTGNRQSDKAGARPALGHLRNRVIQFELEGYNDSTVAQWDRDFASKNGVLPALIDVAKNHACDGFFADQVPLDGGFNSFRGLTNVSALISTYIERKGTTKLDVAMVSLIAAVIGQDAAEIIEDHFDCEGEIPTADEILRAPDSAMLPDQTGYQNLAGSLALEIANDEQSADAAIKYITRLRPDLQVQLGVRLISKSARLGNILISTTAVDFIKSHTDLIQLAKDIEV